MALLPDKSKLKSTYNSLKEANQSLDWGCDYTDLRDCSPIFQESFHHAWKAIEYGRLNKLHDSVEQMKVNADSIEGYLDVCYLQLVWSQNARKNTVYCMTLLAHAAVQRNKNMMYELIKYGAKSSVGNVLTGIPLTQLLTYALHHGCSEEIDDEVVRCLLNKDKLDVDIVYILDYESSPYIEWCSIVNLAIKNKRIDVAKQLVTAGANPIHPGSYYGVAPIFKEYYEFGTNEYMCWLLHEHLLSRALPEFINSVVNLDIFSDSSKRMFAEVGRHPAHAVLTCRHEKMAKQFLQTHGTHLLYVKDVTTRLTALQISAQKGDLESVDILLTFDYNDKQDMAQALLAAARRGYKKIMRCILQKDVFIMNEELPDCNNTIVLAEAMTEGLSSLFEVLRDVDIMMYQFYCKSKFKTCGTLAHLAVLYGRAQLFKVFFPLEAEIKESGIQRDDPVHNMFEALTWVNNDSKTPLHLAIENNHLCILRTLQERIEERESHPCAEQNKEKNAWEAFWYEYGPELLIYACEHGTVDAVKLLLDMMCPLDYKSPKGETPLSVAARSGKADTLQYLFMEYEVSTESRLTPEDLLSSLLFATENDHADCVSILLKKGANVKGKSTSGVNEGYNCLMIAIQRKHSDVVMAILSHEFKALRCSKGLVTPMRLLIEHLPDIAEWVLNRCVILKSVPPTNTDESVFKRILHGLRALLKRKSREEVDSGTSNDDRSQDTENEVEFLEDFSNTLLVSDQSIKYKVSDDESTVDLNQDKDWPLQTQYKSDSGNHTVEVMMKFDRNKLLNHVLVKALIQYKWWRVGFPILLISYGFHVLFLALLTAFALVLPRAGPSCVVMDLALNNATTSDIIMKQNTNFSLNETVETCNVVGTSDERISAFLYTSAVIVILICIYYLFVELFQLYKRRRAYFTDPQNYFEVITYFCVIIFVFPVGHTCWCYPSWKWQIGALALFLTWIYNFILLKHIPIVGQPITMLFNVYVNFIMLIYLPILLIVTFALPFYMLFIGTLEGADSESMLTISFLTPFHAMWDVILQTAGGPDANELFAPTLSHRIMTYILFITFIVAMPILFNNFLIGLAVGETEEERSKAESSITRAEVKYIFESLHSAPLWLQEKLWRWSYVYKCPKLPISERDRKVLEQYNETFLEKFEAGKIIRENTQKLEQKMAQIQTSMTELQQQNQAIMSTFQGEMKKNQANASVLLKEIKQYQAKIHSKVYTPREKSVATGTKHQRK